jgi:type III secretion protein V
MRVLSDGRASLVRPQRPYADAALAFLLLGVVALMIIPIPTPLLDVLIAGNIALSVLMLLCSMAIANGLAFTTMPTVLLCTTLYRLALNVSSTRLILLQADAGRVIRAFGDYVVRGNYVVGAVVFFILTLIQYVVVARGSERVAEVGARFSLDAMPGKQMAIDADLRAGALTPDAAREQRRVLERESQFYGAMDGAMKFVKGDAIAGIVITIVNIVAGIGIGVGMRKLSALQSLHVYGLLTIGDGLVCQIPSLLISTGAGLVVTRVASGDEGASLGGDVGNQLFGNPRVLATGAVFLAFLALVPGLPALPFGFLALLLGASAYALGNAARRRALGGGRLAHADASRWPELAPLSIELGAELAAELAAGRVPLEAAIDGVREQLFAQLGLVLPAVHVQARAELAPRGVVLALSEVPLPGCEMLAVEGAQQAANAIAQLLSRAARRHAAELLGLQETQALLDGLERSAPALVHNTVPKPVSLKLLAEVLRRLLAEGVSIRPLGQILEALGAETAQGDDPSKLGERVRLRLSRQITFSRAHRGVVTLHPLDPMIEDALRDAAAASADAGGLALPPDQAREIVVAVQQAIAEREGAPCTLVTQPDVRRQLSKLLQTELPEVAVLSYAELASDARVDRRAAIRISKGSS